MAWCRPGDKPLSEPMLVRLPTRIPVTRPQWVKNTNFECIFVISIIYYKYKLMVWACGQIMTMWHQAIRHYFNHSCPKSAIWRHWAARVKLVNFQSLDVLGSTINSIFCLLWWPNGKGTPDADMKWIWTALFTGIVEKDGNCQPMLLLCIRVFLAVNIVLYFLLPQIQSHDHPEYGLSQWEMTLQCNVIYHWLSP